MNGFLPVLTRKLSDWNSKRICSGRWGRFSSDPSRGRWIFCRVAVGELGLLVEYHENKNSMLFSLQLQNTFHTGTNSIYIEKFSFSFYVNIYLDEAKQKFTRIARLNHRSWEDISTRKIIMDIPSVRNESFYTTQNIFVSWMSYILLRP